MVQKCDAHRANLIESTLVYILPEEWHQDPIHSTAQRRKQGPSSEPI